MTENGELRVIVPAKFEDIEIREASNKTAGRMVADVDNSPASGKEAYGRILDTAINFLWSKVKDDLSVDPTNKTSVERAAAYYSAIDNAISTIVTADASGELSEENINELDNIRSEINKKHRMILGAVISKHRKPADDECDVCGALLMEDRCVVCSSASDGLKKEAGSPKLDFYESGFVVGLATDISNYVVTSGMNMNDAINIAKDTFGLTQKEEFRLRKYLGYMGHMAPQMIWLPAAENRHA